jgi:hypothetical protein
VPPAIGLQDNQAMTDEELRDALDGPHVYGDAEPVPAGATTATAYGRDDNDAFWERKITEAEANGGSIGIEMSEIPPVPGVVFCMPSARVGGGKRIILEGTGDAVRMSEMVPSWVDQPGRPPVMATSAFRLTVGE